MTMKILAAAASIATVLVTARAADASPTTSTFAYFNGSWTCATSTTSDPGKTHTRTIAVATAPGGLETQTWAASTASGMGVATYDPTKKQYVYVEADSPGSYSTSISFGWNGRSLVWKDVSAGGPDAALGVFTITKQSATRWSYVYKLPNDSEKGMCSKR
jgi:hypothetical protein